MEELLLEYWALRSSGLTHDEALDRMDYLHAITLARLIKRLAKAESGHEPS